MSDGLIDRFQTQLWVRIDPAWPWWRRSGLRIAQYTAALARELGNGELSMRAMSLVYTTLLSLVPLLALSFSVLKALGVHNSMEPVLLNMLSPLGDKAGEITTTVIGFVENIQVGVLGSLGVALLFYTAISMIQKVETSFNRIWRIERTRRLTQRFGDYLSVLIVGPVLVFTAIGITATASSNSVVNSLAEIEPIGSMIVLGSRAVPYLLIIAAFTFLYAFIPNTRVKLHAAAAGGLLAGVMWESASLAFAQFAASASTYSAVYSGFAILLFLLIWLYVGWLILLIGCQLAFLIHYPGYVRPSTAGEYIGNRTREHAAMQVMALIAQRFVAGEPPLAAEQLAGEIGERAEAVYSVIERLRAAGLLVETDDSPPGLLPARDLDAMTLACIIDAVRDDRAEERGRSEPLTASQPSRVFQEIAAYESAIDAALDGRTIRDLVRAGPPSGAADHGRTQTQAHTQATAEPDRPATNS